MIRPSLFEIESDWRGEGVRVAVFGELDLATSPRLEHEMQAVLGREPHSVTIDLSGLAFVDSSGLRVLIALNELSQAQGWELRLVAPSERARAVFRISGAEEHLPFIAEEEEEEEEEDPPFVEESLA